MKKRTKKLAAMGMAVVMTEDKGHAGESAPRHDR